MSALLHFVGTLTVCSAVVPALLRARWTWRAPLLGIVIWQLLLLTWALCLVGAPLALGLEPYRSSLPTALARAVSDLAAGQGPADFTAVHRGLLMAGAAVGMAMVGATAMSWAASARTRRRHRALLAVIARGDPALPGVCVLDHPLPAAYCVPGLRPRIVVSSGARRILTRHQLDAVLAHEWAHARERHHLVILPFSVLRRLLPRSPTLGAVFGAVALLVEMRADDVARESPSGAALAGALHRFRRLGSLPPTATLGIVDSSVAPRLDRLDRPCPRLPAAARTLILGTALVLASTPISFLVLPQS